MMTLEQIEAMDDRELDAAVATRVMGWTLRSYEDYEVADPATCRWHLDDGWTWDGWDHDGEAYEWRPSTDMACAWQVYESMLKRPGANRWVLVERAMGLPSARFYWNDDRADVAISAKTMPRAICIAALMAVEASK